MEATRCGLVELSSYKPISLQDVDVKVSINGFVASVVSKLTYVNDKDEPVEGTFTFPMEENSAVYHFQAQINDLVIIAECMDKKQAEETYKEAVNQGHTAFLLQQSDATSDIFSCRVGNIPPKTPVVITFQYVIELTVQVDSSVKFTLPRVLNPRYNPIPGVAVPADGKEKSGVKWNGKMTFAASVQSAWPISAINLYDSCLASNISADAKTTAEVTLTGEAPSDKDLSFNVHYENSSQPAIAVEKGDSSKEGFLKNDVVMLSFFPKFSSAVKSDAEQNHEFVFIIDRSGSMQGTKIDNAKTTLLYFLKSLPVDCYFNVISFGSDFTELFSGKSAQYSESSLQTALDLQNSMQADMGGTEILRPLNHLFSQPLIPGYPRNLFLLTDGEVHNTRDVISAVARHSKNTRVFTFGIGEGASTALINGVARAGNGKAEFVTDSELLQKKVIASMKVSMQPVLTVDNIRWEGNVTTITKDIGFILPDSRFILYGLLREPLVKGDTVKAVLLGTVASEPYVTHVELPPVTSSNVDLLLHRLAAKAQIRVLEDALDEANSPDRKASLEAQLLAVSLASNVVCRVTAHVGVDRDHKPIKTLSLTSPPPPMHMMMRSMGLPPLMAMACASLSPLMARARAARAMPGASIAMAMERRQVVSIEKVCYKKAFGGCLFNEIGMSSSYSIQCCASSNDVEDKVEESYNLTPTPVLLPRVRIQPRQKNCYNVGPERDGIGAQQMGTPDGSSGPVLPPRVRIQPRQNNCYSVGPERDVNVDQLYDPSLPTFVPAAPPPPALSALPPVSQAVQLQKFQGNWTLSPELAALLRVSEQSIRDSNPFGTAIMDAWVTALVLTWLETRQADKKDVWELIADKAHKWFATRLSDRLKDKAMAAARKLLANAI